MENVIEGGFLVLTRRIDEKIIVGDNEVEVTLLGLEPKHNRARLGVRTLDKNTSIHREEVFNKIKSEEATK